MVINNKHHPTGNSKQFLMIFASGELLRNTVCRLKQRFLIFAVMSFPASIYMCRQRQTRFWQRYIL
jgi:uncharacterized membrane protein